MTVSRNGANYRLLFAKTYPKKDLLAPVRHASKATTGESASSLLALTPLSGVHRNMKKKILAGLFCLLLLSQPAFAEDPATTPGSVAAPAAGTATSSVTAPLSGLASAIQAKGASYSPIGAEAPADAQLKSATAEAAAREAGEAPGTAETMSPEEISMSAEDDDVSKPRPFKIGKLTQFGYSFFRQPVAFAPVADAPVGPDYIVGPGDTLILTVWGSLEATLPLEVNRSGEITLPRVGNVRVWGVPYSKLPEVIREALLKTYRTVNLNVTMGKLRLMKVYVVGEINAPGAYDISALSTVINALAAAGGPSKQGTLRSIQVLREGKIVETVDLYDFFLKGDKTRDIRLHPGDTINVPMHGRLVGIAGNVRKPAIYEFLKESTLKDLFELAGGVPPSSYLQRIQISRVMANDKKLVADFNFDTTLSGKTLDQMSGAVALQDMDIVKVFPIDFKVRDHVKLDGYVLRPGGYALKPDMRVKDLIGADNLLPEYYPETIEITRLVGPDFHPVKIYLNLDQALKGSEKDNILLHEFDTVRIFSRWEMEEIPKVTISGDVQKPGAYRIFSEMTLRDLVFASGNLKKTAYLMNAEITRSVINKSGVKSHLINVDLDEALKGNPKDNVVLQNFDEVVIRRVPEWKEETDRYVTLSGQVRFPGAYPILRGEKLSSVIGRAGGYTERAYLKAAKFTRKLTQEIQQKRMDEVIIRTEQELSRKQQELTSVASSKEELEATRATIEGMRVSLEKLKLAKAEGRISLQLTPVNELKKSPYDLELQGGDALEIPQSSNSIMVFGEVYSPTTVVQVPRGTVGAYLKDAGGPTTNADDGEMYVVRADGKVVSKREMSSFVFFNSFMSMELDAGDTIVVPQRIERVAWMRDLKDIAFIIGQTALAAGVLIAAGL